MRLAAQAKGGYYPTPDRVVDMIADLIDTPIGYHYHNNDTLRILDPCCGAGDAVERLARRIHQASSVPVETYGVELHSERAEEAAPRLHRTLSADLFRTSIANGAFGVLYLNPPYDFDAEDKRTEHAFLTHTTRYLAEEGLLVFIVPRQRLTVSARYLSTHYRRIRCWAFPQPEREVFDQVVLLAYRKVDPSPDPYGEAQIREWARGEPEPLRFSRYGEFTAPTMPEGDVLFATRTVDPVAAATEARRSGPLDQRSDNRLPLARQGGPRQAPDAPAQGAHGHAGGGGVPGQPLSGIGGKPHPGQGQDLQDHGDGGGLPRKGGAPGAGSAPRWWPWISTMASSPTSRLSSEDRRDSIQTCQYTQALPFLPRETAGRVLLK